VGSVGRPKLKLIGRRFKRLKVVEFKGVTSTYPHKSLWECLCNCGDVIVVTGDNLMTGNTKSCGCLRKYIAKRTVRKKFQEYWNRGNHPRIV